MPAETERPAGFHSVTPRMVVGDVAAEVEFLRAVFDALGDLHAGRPAEIRIGDSLVMVSPAGERDLFPVFLYVYVDDADSAYRRPLAAGDSEPDRRQRLALSRPRFAASALTA